MYNFCAEVKDLTCIVCKRGVFPPISQCQNGHIACKYCSDTTGAYCKAFSRSINRIRNVALERIIASATVTCKYARMGCMEHCSFVSRAAHEQECSFEPKLCPVPRCTRAGFANCFADHLKSTHNVDVVLNLEVDEIHGEYSLTATISLDFVAPKVALLMDHDHHQINDRGDCYLLHQEICPSGDQLIHVTAVDQARQRKYQIAVEIGGELTYCYKSLCTARNVVINPAAQYQPGGGLLVQKPQPDGAPATLPGLDHTMLCRIRLE